MKIFTVDLNQNFDGQSRDTKYQFVCQWFNTRTGFKHECTTIRNTVDIGTVKCTYQNRTWERYTYESVLHKAIDKLELTDEQKQIIKDQCYAQRG